MRVKAGDSNKVAEIESFVNQRKNSSDVNDNEMFFFGEDFGNGSDESHFHVGMTSIELLRRCADGGHRLYHIDATYKV